MSAEDVEKLDESVQPVQFMLAKVIWSPIQFPVHSWLCW
jgi:hypothetical protein